MDFIAEYIENFGIMAMLAIVFGASLRAVPSAFLRQLGLGLLFGGAAIFAMVHPILLADGAFVDPRNIFIGFSAAFIGPLAGLVTWGMALAYRVSLGGAGVYAGSAATVIAIVAGLAWSRLVHVGRSEVRLVHFLLLGFMLAAEIFAALLLPLSIRRSFYADTAIIVVLMDVISAVIMGAFFERERRIAQQEIQLRAAAISDPLTGLLNRRGFDQSQATLRAGFAQRGYVVLAVDLDHFKHINDVHGHDGGDRILTQVAAALRRGLAHGTILSRFGGEEFVAVLPECGRAAGEEAAEALRLAIESLVEREGCVPERITTSIGGCWVSTPDDLTRALTLADRALYEAKRKGRNRVVFSAGVRPGEDD